MSALTSTIDRRPFAFTHRMLWNGDVCFTPESGHYRTDYRFPLRAKVGSQSGVCIQARHVTS